MTNQPFCLELIQRVLRSSRKRSLRQRSRRSKPKMRRQTIHQPCLPVAWPKERRQTRVRMKWTPGPKLHMSSFWKWTKMKRIWSIKDPEVTLFQIYFIRNQQIILSTPMIQMPGTWLNHPTYSILKEISDMKFKNISWWGRSFSKERLSCRAERLTPMISRAITILIRVKIKERLSSVRNSWLMLQAQWSMKTSTQRFAI